MFADRLKRLRKEHGYTQESLAAVIGVERSSVGKYEGKSGVIPSNDVLARIADLFGVSIDYLLERENRNQISPANQTFPPNILPVQRRKIPILGNVAAGEPIFADEEHEEYVIDDDANDCDFALRIAGDSMEPLLHDGDIVYVRQQDDVNDGEIGILLLDDEAVIKHIYHIPDGVQVVSQNAAKYPPKTYTWPNYDTIRILGRAVAYRRNL